MVNDKNNLIRVIPDAEHMKLSVGKSLNPSRVSELRDDSEIIVDIKDLVFQLQIGNETFVGRFIDSGKPELDLLSGIGHFPDCLGQYIEERVAQC